MKNILKIYLITFSIFFIPFLLFSFIFAILSYFIQFNQLYLQIIIQIIAYLFIVISALYLSSQLVHKRLLYCGLFSFIYFIFSLLFNLSHINYYFLLSKSFIFILIGLIKEIKKG